MSSLTEKRPWVYNAKVSGRWVQLRQWTGWFLIAFFVLMPWIRIGGLPGVRIDIPGRRLILLGQLFTPHDTWAFALLGLSMALSLFLFTSLLGRVWCGWACPQTVWLEWIYRPVERWIEGSANKRKKLDDGPRDFNYYRIKGSKYAAYAVITSSLTLIFMSWFVGGPELLAGQFGWSATIAGLFLFGVFYADAAWFREQLCHYACPYARFQGVLMDAKSLIVSYDVHRGEPRGKKKDDTLGDCISCMRCVQVCPMGIDIRDGDQLQCISCASCADACDEIMVKIGKPEGLIRYTTERDAPATPGEGVPKVFRPRIYGYSALLALVFGALLVGLATRAETQVWVARAAGNQIFRALPDGSISNQFNLHVNNRDAKPWSYTVRSATEGISITAPGQPWVVEPGGELRRPAFIAAAPQGFQAGRLPAKLEFVRDDGEVTPIDLTMLGPEGGLGGATR